MGIADREYNRLDYEPRRAGSAVGAMHMWSVTTWLIVINVAVFVVNNVLLRERYLVDTRTREIVGVIEPLPTRLGAFTVGDAIYRLQIWRFITFQFLHANLSHILFNMFSLYMFGTLIEQYLGRRRYLAFYLLSGVGGGLMYVMLWYLGFFGAAKNTVAVPLVGASAGIFGVLIAAAVIAPNATVLIYGSIPAKLKTLAWVLIGIALFAIFGGGYNRGGEAAHLGGAVVGFLLIKRPQVLNVFEAGYTSARQRQIR